MNYLIGGAPRAGKSTLAQKVASEQRLGWISTDILVDLLKTAGAPGTSVKGKWDARPSAIVAAADWFYPILERFVWSSSGMAGGYVIEGVDFLPMHVMKLMEQYPIRTLFLGNSQLTRAGFEQFPGQSKGYAALPEDMKDQIVRDVPLWSEFVRHEAERCGLPYVDTSGDFAIQLQTAAKMLDHMR